MRLPGAADARRARNGNVRPPDTEADIEISLHHAREALSADEWQVRHGAGHSMALEDALTTAEQPSPSARSHPSE
jgi:hypothetical protein